MVARIRRSHIDINSFINEKTMLIDNIENSTDRSFIDK